jgi:hypothetical protein
MPKRTVLLVALVTWSTAGPTGHARRTTDTRYDQLVQTEAAWDAANLHHDIAALRRLLAPDFIQINRTGASCTARTDWRT